jgi:uncharacterized protein (UPF0335 family)
MGNEIDSGLAQEFVERIESLESDRLSEHAAYMAKCKKIAEDKKAVLAEAASNGFQKRVIKATVKERELLAKIKKLGDGFDIDEQSQYDQLSKSIGAFAELPLGRAALDAAKKGPTVKKPKADKKQKADKKAVGDAANTATTNH